MKLFNTLESTRTTFDDVGSQNDQTRAYHRPLATETIRQPTAEYCADNLYQKTLLGYSLKNHLSSVMCTGHDRPDGRHMSNVRFIAREIPLLGNVMLRRVVDIVHNGRVVNL